MILCFGCIHPFIMGGIHMLVIGHASVIAVGGHLCLLATLINFWAMCIVVKQSREK
jgi:hypothetical protein